MKFLPLLLTTWLTTVSAQLDNAPFADALTSTLYSSDGNECTSSLGVSMAMSLVYPAAISDSEEQLRTVFGYPADQSKLLWQDTTDSLTNRYGGRCYNEFDGQCQGEEALLEIANSVFVDQDVVLNATYAGIVGDLVQQLDFGSDDAGTLVNTWVNESTNGLIDAIVPEGALDPWIVLAINSIYLKASWANQFNEAKTNADDFLVNGAPTEAHFMNQVADFQYSHDIESLPGFQILQHSFDGEYEVSTGLSMIFVLPPVDSPTMATSQDVLAAIPELSRTQVALALPKFRYESTYEDSLKDALKTLGSEAVFDDQRQDNLCIQDGRCDTYIDVIIQKTLMDVNEKGVEAAAVTAIGMMATSFNPQAMLFQADRAFQFFLYDENDKVVLFEGRVAEPGVVEGSQAPLEAKHADADFWMDNFGHSVVSPDFSDPGEPVSVSDEPEIASVVPETAAPSETEPVSETAEPTTATPTPEETTAAPETTGADPDAATEETDSAASSIGMGFALLVFSAMVGVIL